MRMAAAPNFVCGCAQETFQSLRFAHYKRRGRDWQASF
jgi:hypothetical protein